MHGQPNINNFMVFACRLVGGKLNTRQEIDHILPLVWKLVLNRKKSNSWSLEDRQTDRQLNDLYCITTVLYAVVWYFTADISVLISSSAEFKPHELNDYKSNNCIIYIYLSGLVTAVAVFRNPNTIPFCFATDLLLNILFSWLLVHLPSTFFLDVLFFFFPLVSTP